MKKWYRGWEYSRVAAVIFKIGGEKIRHRPGLHRISMERWRHKNSAYSLVRIHKNFPGPQGLPFQVFQCLEERAKQKFVSFSFASV